MSRFIVTIRGRRHVPAWPHEPGAVEWQGETWRPLSVASVYRLRYGHPVTVINDVPFATGRTCDLLGSCSDFTCTTCWNYPVRVSMWTLGGDDPIARNARRRDEYWRPIHHVFLRRGTTHAIRRLRLKQLPSRKQS